ncbi:NAD(P)/FAD-dependent oxidoreductase [Nonlabens xiamenensis]|uniref:NAD(P)/FAD-dependent oxidoreductase n=1 Tax=Nonlabens xiamenensis TaxID=2341043 RepID=UPI000F607F92|nr:FAD-binding oxidoreductase [Nonlabens xiamenensis]
MKDAIIIGSGIAGSTLAWFWKFQGKNITLIGDGKKAASAVAAGVYNPLILKRFTKVWKAGEQLDAMQNFYPRIEARCGRELLHSTYILRRLHHEAEASTWRRKAQREDLMPFMDQNISHTSLSGINSPYGFGKVPNTGWLDAGQYMKATQEYFSSKDSFISEHFDHSQLVIEKEFVSYKQLKARHIIFAEGVAIRSNPWFNDLPLQGNKGEVLLVKVPGLQLDCIVKSAVFLMPYKDDLFWVGATYDREDLSDTPTQNAYDYLTDRLERFLDLPYEVIKHLHGIRPTTMDRRPFLGFHKSSDRLLVFNGMGSRSVLVAPWAANELFNHVYQDKSLHPEIGIARFR